MTQISDATSVVKEDISQEIVTKFGDRGKETEREVTGLQDDQEAALVHDPVTGGGGAGTAEAGAGHGLDKGVEVSGHLQNPQGGAENLKRQARPQREKKNQKVRNVQGQLGGQSRQRGKGHQEKGYRENGQGHQPEMIVGMMISNET